MRFTLPTALLLGSLQGVLHCHDPGHRSAPSRTPDPTGDTMKAFVVTHYGPDGLEPVDVPTPTVGTHDVLVDIRAASINPLDKMVRNRSTGRSTP